MIESSLKYRIMQLYFQVEGHRASQAPKYPLCQLAPQQESYHGFLYLVIAHLGNAQGERDVYMYAE